jgi:hypothetical protein
LGGGEPNDDLTWALFDDKVKGGQAERSVDRDSADHDELADDATDRTTGLEAPKAANRGGVRDRQRS